MREELVKCKKNDLEGKADPTKVPDPYDYRAFSISVQAEIPGSLSVRSPEQSRRSPTKGSGPHSLATSGRRSRSQP
jgi:hypothetical protein